jgi:hypothetical protein
VRLSELIDRAQLLIEKSKIPKKYKSVMLELLMKFGYEWHTNLANTENRLGSGNPSSSILIDIPFSQEEKLRLNEAIRHFAEKNGDPVEDPLDSFLEWVEEIEFTDWKDRDQSELSFKQNILWDWRELRIDYYRSVMKMKTPLAREMSDKDVESIDIGISPLTCRTCGVFFFDNLEKHFGIRALYCSITCETNAELICIQCGNEFKVGKGVAQERVMKLEGFCSKTCQSDFKSDKESDHKYAYSMKRMAKYFNASYDETITRREIFRSANGICAICGALTHFENSKEYSPLLATVDHIIPWTKGGGHTWENVQLCCLRCNIVKGNRMAKS